MRIKLTIRLGLAGGLFALASLSALVGCTGSSQPTSGHDSQALSEVVRAVKDAERATERKDYDTAITFYNEAIEWAIKGGGTDKGMAELYYRRGWSKFQKYQETVVTLGMVLERIEKGSKESVLEQRDLLLESALADFTDSIRHGSRSGSAYLSRGYIYAALDQMEKAAADFSVAIDLGTPSNSSAHLQRCLAYEKLRRKDEAIRDCRKAAELDPASEFTKSTLKRLEGRKIPRSLFERITKDGEEIQFVFYQAGPIDLNKKGLAPNVKIGVFNVQAILERTRAGKRTQEGLTEYVNTRQKLLALSESRLKELEKQLPTTPAGDRKEKLKARFRTEFTDYQNRRKDFEEEIKQKQKEVTDLYNQRLETVAAKVAKRDGFDVIMDNFANSPELMELLPAAVREVLKRRPPDVIDSLVAEFDKTYESGF